MRKLYTMNVGFRGCELSGLFIATQEQIDEVIGQEMYWGEVCGKHSDVIFSLEEKEIKMISDDQDLINYLEEIFDSTTLCGYNPIEIYREQDA